MKTYPTIQYAQESTRDVVVYDKLDGSNIRAEWSKNKGFYKFGSRHKLIDTSSGLLNLAPDLIIEKYNEVLSKDFTDAKYERAIAFFEFFGTESFAGTHHEGDDFDVILFDVQPYKQRMMNGFDFFNRYSERCEIPSVLSIGKFTRDMYEEVRNGTLSGMTFEGVVCKGDYTRHNDVYMFKQKSDAWIEKLRGQCGDDDEKFEKLV